MRRENAPHLIKLVFYFLYLFGNVVVGAYFCCPRLPTAMLRLEGIMPTLLRG